MNRVILRNARVFSASAGTFEPRDLCLRGTTFCGPEALAEEKGVFRFDLGGALVIPPLVDFNCHAYYRGSGFSLNPEYLPAMGVLYVCDGGTAGLSGLPGLLHYIEGIESSMQMRYWLNLSPVGIHENFQELTDASRLGEISFDGTDKRMRSRLVGITVRLTHHGARDSVIADQAFDTALELCEREKLPLMVNLARSCYPIELLMERMRPGDVISEIYHDAGEIVLDSRGKVRRCIWEARERGVRFDLAHGMGCFSLRIAQRCIAQGFLPDFISTNGTVNSLHLRPMYSLLNVMSKFLAMGVPLEQVILRVTTWPAEFLRFDGYPGELERDQDASLVGLSVRRGDWKFYDAREGGNALGGDELLETAFVFRQGNLIARQETALL